MRRTFWGVFRSKLLPNRDYCAHGLVADIDDLQDGEALTAPLLNKIDPRVLALACKLELEFHNAKYVTEG